jgi:hypothetical protein
VTRVASDARSTVGTGTYAQVGRAVMDGEAGLSPARPRSAHRDTPGRPHAIHSFVHRLWVDRGEAGVRRCLPAAPRAVHAGSVPAQRRPARVPRRPEFEEIPWRRATTATA